jgi:hypothetical protein
MNSKFIGYVENTKNSWPPEKNIKSKLKQSKPATNVLQEH